MIASHYKSGLCPYESQVYSYFALDLAIDIIVYIAVSSLGRGGSSKEACAMVWVEHSGDTRPISWDRQINRLLTSPVLCVCLFFSSIFFSLFERDVLRPSLSRGVCVCVNVSAGLSGVGV